jgi:hypothetical protein
MLARDPDRALAAGAPNGCAYGQRNVNVCYSPWRVDASEPARRLPRGEHGVALRRGPSPDAPVIRDDAGAPIVVPVGGFFGRQSKRDGGAAAGCPDPGARPARGVGFVFGYVPRGSRPAKSGWLATSYGGRSFAVSDESSPDVLCGPDGLDFDCRGGAEGSSPYRSSCGPRAGGSGSRKGYVCGGAPARPHSCFPSQPTRVEAVRTPLSTGLDADLGAERYALRYLPGGATLFWLTPGDSVRQFCVECLRLRGDPECPPPELEARSHECCVSASCVEVLSAAWAPTGTRGWVDSSVLADRGDPPTLRAALGQIARDVFLI